MSKHKPHAKKGDCCKEFKDCCKKGGESCTPKAPAPAKPANDEKACPAKPAPKSNGCGPGGCGCG